MDASYWTTPLLFLVNTVSSLYISAVMLRFLLQWRGADFYNPILQLLVKVTHPPLRILRRFVPPMGRIDTSSLVLMLGLQMLTDLTVLLITGRSFSMAVITLSSVTQLIALLINVYIFAIFIRVLLSWFTPGAYNETSYILVRLTEPLLEVFRKVIPDLGPLDLSPVVALLCLQLAKLLILPPLEQLARLLV